MRETRALALLAFLAAAQALLFITAIAEERLPEAPVEATLPAYGYSLGVGFGAIWLAAANTCFRIDPVANTVTEIPLRNFSSWFHRLAVGEDAVWVPGNTHIYQIDPAQRHVVREIPIAAAPATGLGAGFGAVWAITGADKQTLARIATASGVTEASIALPAASSSVLAAFGSIWVSGTGEDALYRIDPATNAIIATIALDDRPNFLTAGEGSVWVFNDGSGAVQRIDGASGKLVASIATGEPGRGSIDVGGGFVWVNTRLVPIIRIDPHSNTITGKFGLERTEYSTIRHAAGALWISGGALRRISPPP